VPDNDGPIHRYLGASPGCWAAYGELSEKEASDYRYMRHHQMTVDAYCAQHPGTPSPQAVRSVADQLQGVSRGEAPTGTAADIVQQISEKVQQIAERLENADPQQLLDEVRRFGRNKPGGFLLGAAAAGFLTGRMVKGATSDGDDDKDFYAGTGGTYATSGSTYGTETYGTGTYATETYATGTEYAGTTGTYGTAAGAPASGVTTGYGTETAGYDAGGFGTDETYPAEPRRTDTGGSI